MFKLNRYKWFRLFSFLKLHTLEVLQKVIHVSKHHGYCATITSSDWCCGLGRINLSVYNDLHDWISLHVITNEFLPF